MESALHGISHTPEGRPQRRDRDVFGILLALYALILYPILRADRYYNDDMKRALVGRASWDSNGRPLTTLLMRALQCYDHAMVDISPLTQIGAVAILAWIGVLMARRYAIRSTWMAALAAFPLGGQPFFLENLSYKFDALSMSLAMLLAVLPILVPGHDRRGWWLGLLALFGSLCFYQPAINAYLVLMVLELVFAQLQRVPPARLARQFLRQALQVGVAMLVYYLLVGMHISGWVKHASERIHGWHQLPLLARNFADFYAWIGTSFNAHWWMYFGPVLMVLAAFPVLVGVRYALDRREGEPDWMRLLMGIGALLLPLVALIAALGPMLLLLRPEIGSRVLMGIGVLLAAALVVMQEALLQWRGSQRWAVAAACMLGLGMATMASAYGNAMSAQKDYESHIGATLADDLTQLAAARGVHGFVLDGAAGDAPIVAHVAEELPLIRSLVPVYLSSDNHFQTPDFLAYYIAGSSNLGERLDPAAQLRAASLRAQSCGMPATLTRIGYRLYVIGDVAVVRLGADNSSICASASDAQPVKVE